MVYLIGQRSKGLGDTVAKVMTITGVKAAVETVTKAIGIEDCGCEKRQEALNKLVPYKNNNDANPEVPSK